VRKAITVLALASLVITALATTGCLSNRNLAETAAESAAPDRFDRVSSQSVSTSDSESRQMIAKMRLLGEGMSPNLDDYDFVELVEMKDEETGETITVVVVSENDERIALMPENMTTSE